MKAGRVRAICLDIQKFLAALAAAPAGAYQYPGACRNGTMFAFPVHNKFGREQEIQVLFDFGGYIDYISRANEHQEKEYMPVPLTVGAERRRSQRIALSLAIDVTNADPSLLFSGRCNTIDVNAHGCQFFLTRPFKHGTPLLISIVDAHQTATAYVVRSMPVSPEMHVRLWKICVEFVRPGNYWEVQSPPQGGDPSLLPPFVL